MSQSEIAMKEVEGFAPALMLGFGIAMLWLLAA